MVWIERADGGCRHIAGKLRLRNEDAALHLHDYNSAYSLVVPAAFLKANLLTLDVFRHFIQENWPEFLENEVFEAPEQPAGSPDEHAFVLAKPGKRTVYHPVFSRDGQFLLTGLTRTQEMLSSEF